MNIVLKEKRNLAVLPYLVTGSAAYFVGTLSHLVFTLLIVVSSLYLLFLLLNKNVKYKDIAMSMMIGLSVFFFGLYLYGI